MGALIRHTFYPATCTQRRLVRHAHNLAHLYVRRRRNVSLHAASTGVLEVPCNAGAIAPSCFGRQSPLLGRVDDAEWCVE